MPDAPTSSSQDCPPPDAQPAAGLVYRCARNNPPAASDLQTHAESGRLRDADPCLRRALSVFRRLEEAEHQIRLFQRWRRRCIARAELAARDGVMKPTPTHLHPTHTSWWPAADLDPTARTALFIIAREVSS